VLLNWDMIVHGCLKDTVIELLIIFRVCFIVLISLTLVVLFVFIYCIFLAIRLPFANKFELRVELKRPKSTTQFPRKKFVT